MASAFVICSFWMIWQRAHWPSVCHTAFDTRGAPFQQITLNRNNCITSPGDLYTAPALNHALSSRPRSGREKTIHYRTLLGRLSTKSNLLINPTTKLHKRTSVFSALCDSSIFTLRSKCDRSVREKKSTDEKPGQRNWTCNKTVVCWIIVNNFS